MEWFYLTLLRPFSKGVLKTLASFANRENKLPNWAFYQMSHVVPYTSFELLILRDGTDGREIFLTQRAPNDPEWPNAWHFPGTIIRIKDSFESIKLRLAKSELGLTELPGEAQFLTMLFDEDKPRGNILHTFHVLRVDSEFMNSNGTFFPIDQLPEDIINFQKRQLKTISDHIKTSS
jgi:ADP-ribose pyrophosphatase YjhB (NUDIX family)